MLLPAHALVKMKVSAQVKTTNRITKWGRKKSLLRRNSFCTAGFAIQDRFARLYPV